MFVLVPPQDAATQDLIEKAVEPLIDSLIEYEIVLLMILQIEGFEQLHIYFAQDSVLTKIDGVEDEAESQAVQVVAEDKKIFNIEGTYICTVVEYLPKAQKYARAITGRVDSSLCALN